jgi:hypothetical protein
MEISNVTFMFARTTAIFVGSNAALMLRQCNPKQRKPRP